ncbi:hypothetical protein ABPG72_006421 [Tetrahymena utriculariae]
MDIEDLSDNSFFGIVKKEEISSQQNIFACQPKLEIVQLQPIKKGDLGDQSDEDEKDSIKKIKQKQLFKRRVCNKLMKYKSNSGDEINRQKYIHVIPNLNISPPIGDYFVFGEIILEGDFKQDPFNMDKTYSWAYFKRSNSVTYLKDIKCIEVEMKRQVNTNQNFSFMTQRYLNTPDQQIHELGQLLQEYENFSKQMLQKMQLNQSYIQENNLEKNLKDLSKKYYKKSMEWMQRQGDENKLYMYLFSEYDFEILDNDYKLIGYSQKLLNLIGLNEVEANNIFMRKGRLEIFDGLSRLYRLMVRLMNIYQNNLGQAVVLDHNIITVDGITIPNKCEIITPPFSCITKENFNHYNYFGDFLMSKYCFFRLFVFHVNPNIIKQVISMREQQKLTPQYLLHDMEYSMLSEVFIDKFYPQNNQYASQIKYENQESEDSKICKYRNIS